MTEESKYDIHINPKKPTKEAIRKKMDFEGAYKSYTHWTYRTPWHRFQRHSGRNRKTTMFIILIIIVAALLAIEWEEENRKQDSLKTPIKNTK